MEIQEPGRREQNKRRTHEALAVAAARLFKENGFEATTVRDIASAAGVGERTFFRYFPTKESLLLQQIRDLIPRVADAIRARPAHEGPLVALRDAVVDLCLHDPVFSAVLLAGRQPLRIMPTSRGERFLLFDLEEAVASAFLDREAPDADLRTPETRLRASVLARAGVGALRALRLAYTQLPESARRETDLSEFADAGFAALLNQRP